MASYSAGMQPQNENPFAAPGDPPAQDPTPSAPAAPAATSAASGGASGGGGGGGGGGDSWIVKNNPFKKVDEILQEPQATWYKRIMFLASLAVIMTFFNLFSCTSNWNWVRVAVFVALQYRSRGNVAHVTPCPEFRGPTQHRLLQHRAASHTSLP